jgi:DNA polymerase-3 subunit delta
LTPEQIIQNIKNKVYHPIYFFEGEESFFIDKVTKYISENILDESEQAFNQITVYGKDVSVDAIVENAKQFPMMSNHRVVIVKEAQHVRNIEKLASYAENSLDSTILVINYKYKKLDGRKKDSKALLKAVKSKGLNYESKKLYDNQVPDWITKYLKSKGFSINMKASFLLTENLGSDLSKISNELDKLMITVSKKTEITSEIIEHNIGISKDFNNFELVNAISKRDILRANKIIKYFAANPKDHPFVMTISTLYNFYKNLILIAYVRDKSKNNIAAKLRIHPFFVGEYLTAMNNFPFPKLVQSISILREYDMKSKGVNNNDDSGELLKELIYRLLH